MFLTPFHDGRAELRERSIVYNNQKNHVPLKETCVVLFGACATWATKNGKRGVELAKGEDIGRKVGKLSCKGYF